MRSSTLRAAPTASDPTPSQAALAPQDVPLDNLAPCVTGSLAGTGVAVPRWTLPDCPHQYPRRRPAPIAARMEQLLSPGLPPEILPGRAMPRDCPCPHHPLGNLSCLAPRLEFHCPFTESSLPSGVGLSRPFVPRAVIGALGSGAGLLEAQNGSLSAYTALIPPELLRQR